jgi:hypothetical protein
MTDYLDAARPAAFWADFQVLITAEHIAQIDVLATTQAPTHG